MRVDHFNRLVDERIKMSAEILKKKGERYSRYGDRLHNFKEIGIRQKMIPEKALKVLVCKHEVNLDDIVNDIAGGDFNGKWSHLLDELFNDAHNYLYLLEGLIVERVAGEREDDPC